jgi:hypothetical protein
LRDALGVGGTVVLGVDAHAGEQVADLAHGVHLEAGALDLLEVRAAGRAITRPTACSPASAARDASHAA